MRKLETKEKREKREKRNQVIISLIMLFVIVFGIAGFGFMSSRGMSGGGQGNQRKIEYNGYTFFNQNGYWTFKLGKNSDPYVLIYNPMELSSSNVSLPEEGLPSAKSYEGEPLYINSENPAVRTEVFRNLNRHSLRMQGACLNESNCTGNNYPVKDCTNNFIVFRQGNENKISINNSCIFITSSEDKSTKVADEFVYRTLGVK